MKNTLHSVRAIVARIVAHGSLLLAFSLALAIALPRLAAQSGGGTSAITGVVSNSKTGQFLEKAQVKVEGTNISTVTDHDGSYRLGDLKPGNYDLVVSYTGLDDVKQTVTVGAGQNQKKDFDLTSAVYNLNKFVVAADAEGNAASINLQKNADYFVQAVSTDTLGNVSEGNIGEFLKYIPGIQVNYVNADANTVSMRGQDPEATSFTFDGQVPAAAGTPPRSSTGSSDASSRAYEFSMTTINNIESIEVYKAPPPWMAPSTGGVINAVTKNAFSQRDRVFHVSASISGNSEMLHFGSVPGPGRRETQRLKPGASMTYSEALLHNTLGVSISYQESNVINPSHNSAIGYSPLVAATTANPITDSTPVYINNFTLVDGPQVKTRRNLGINLDYKLTSTTVLKLRTSYNYYLSQNRSHTFRVKALSATPVAGSNDRDTSIVAGGVDVFDDYSDAQSQTYGYTGTVEHKFGPWKIDYSAGYGKSDAKTSDLPEMINSVQFNLVAANGVNYHMTASPDTPAPTSFQQTAGPDLYNLANYPTPSGFTVQTQPRFQSDHTVNLALNVKRDFGGFRIPFDIRAGGGLYSLHRHKAAGQIVLTFVGPDGVAGTGDETLNAALFNDDTYGDKFLYGIRTPPLLDPYKVADYMKQNPKAFQDIQPTNVQRQAVNTQSMAQDITSAYIASTLKFGPKLSIMMGVRGEKTENFVRGAIRINSLGAGLVNNSKEFFQAIYSQTQRVTNNYTDYFPNLQATYRFTPNLIFRAALTRSMSRPGVQTILPNTTVNDTAAIPSVTVNNTALLPTYSRNIDVQMEYYAKPSSTITLDFFKKTITNYIITDQTTIQPGADNGFDGQYAGYLLNTQDNGGKGNFQGVEASIRQQLRPYLSALPELMRGFDLTGGYTYNLKGEAPDRTGKVVTALAPSYYKWNASYGISYSTPRNMFYLNVRTTIFPQAPNNTPSATVLQQYEARHQAWDATLRVRFNTKYYAELQGANIFNDPRRNFVQSGRHIQNRVFGAQYTLSLNANF